MMQHEEVVRKLQKIMAMADKSNGASEGEIENAMRIARKMMDKYGVSEAEIASYRNKESAPAFSAEDCHEFRYVKSYEPNLSAFLWAACTLCDCEFYLMKFSGKRTVRFYGVKSDAATAAALCEILWKSAKRIARKEYGYRGGKDLDAFLVGFGERLYSRAKEIVNGVKKEDPKGTGLIVLSKSSAISSYRETKLSLRKSKARSRNLDAGAYGDGNEAGASVSLKTNVIH